jgi:hypothetical protein
VGFVKERLNRETVLEKFKEAFYERCSKFRIMETIFGN